MDSRSAATAPVPNDRDAGSALRGPVRVAGAAYVCAYAGAYAGAYACWTIAIVSPTLREARSREFSKLAGRSFPL